ncbi:hypothetical protein K450DRAFT_219754 [Umbelopsis ramanniana AG]|uniref:Uncharacterized protein n=1 Tax=Umbelopsis ramanniana AG TaxID=1314678 RepID=A0AAD5EJC5_UMBRA|nr:uncharacterized protein K450DRAFT_219754 [Umbelopsis ramanniana AG]KAI8584412.1 hypothetical protein K450DRAFT_219754 [Umbelopsis ramanniana AG]
MSYDDPVSPRDIPRRRPSFASNLAHSVESWSSSYARSLHYLRYASAVKKTFVPFLALNCYVLFLLPIVKT